MLNAIKWGGKCFKDDADVYIDFGDDADEGRDAALARMIGKSRENGMTEEGARGLSALVERHKTILEFIWAGPYQPMSPLGNPGGIRPAGSKDHASSILSRSAHLPG